MAFDMTNTLMDYFVAHLKDEINTGITSTHILYIKEVTREPLQDDPTKRSPYLSIEPDTTLADLNNHNRTPVTGIRRGMLGANADTPSYEIGGGFLMLNFFLIQGWLKKCTTREEAYLVGGGVLRRLEGAFARIAHSHFDNSILQTDDGLEWTASYPNMLGEDGGHFYLGGGDRTWLPQITFRFHVFTEIAREYWGVV